MRRVVDEGTPLGAPTLVDCDPGIDDAIALLLALGSEELDIIGVTAVSGNLPASTTCLNLIRVLTLAEAGPVPIGRGPDRPLVGHLASDPFSHGPGGLGGRSLPLPPNEHAVEWAPDLIVRLAQQFSGDLTIITLGPLTNLALALKQEPRLPTLVRRIVSLGGNFGKGEHAWRNGTGDNPVSEWNIYVDPEAASEVINAGFNLTFVGLDISTSPEINLEESDVAFLRSTGPIGAFAADMVAFVEGRGFQSYCALIDSVAVGVAARPEMSEAQRVRCGVELNGSLTRGMTVIDDRHHHAWEGLAEVEVVTHLDYSRFKQILLQRLS